MEAFKTVIWIVNIISALAVIVLVLLQHGKGADAGTPLRTRTDYDLVVFGSGGSANFLTRSTAIAATVFFATCMAMVYIHSNTTRHGLDFSTVQQSQPAQTAPAPSNTNTTPAAPAPASSAQQ